MDTDPLCEPGIQSFGAGGSLSNGARRPRDTIARRHESVAGALLQALAMPLEERRARHEALYAKVCEYDVNRWQREFLSTLRAGSGRETYRPLELLTLDTIGARIAPSAGIEH